jgi:hypothetical protein
MSEQMNEKKINEIKKKIEEGINRIKALDITKTKPGSIKYLLYGEEDSEQSISIKVGKVGEIMAIAAVNNSNLKLLECGIQLIDNKTKKDIDLLFIDEQKKIVYYRELKGNATLDTEKLPATIEKINKISQSLQEKYPEYEINKALLAWSIWEKSDLCNDGIKNLDKYIKQNISVEHAKDLFDIVELTWNKEDYYDFWRNMGTILKSN